MQLAAMVLSVVVAPHALALVVVVVDIQVAVARVGLQTGVVEVEEGLTPSILQLGSLLQAVCSRPQDM
jgi:hypothetical protein